MFRTSFHALGLTAPRANAGALFVVALCFAAMWVFDFIWVRLHLRVKITPTELTKIEAGGKREVIELLGLKHSDDPLDYSETFLGGFGTFEIATRTGSRIFKMQRIFHLYRLWWWPWSPGKMKRILDLIAGAQVSIAPDQTTVVEATSDEGTLGEEDREDTDVDLDAEHEDPASEDIK
jgi:hypothetical protein